MSSKDRFFTWEVDDLTKPEVLDFAAENFAGENIVLHIKQYNVRWSWFLKWNFVDFEHHVSTKKQIRRGEQKKFMPQYPHYQLRRLVRNEDRWHICQVSAVKEGESTWPLPDGRAEEA